MQDRADKRSTVTLAATLQGHATTNFQDKPLMNEQKHDVLVAGAGFSGLATTAALRRYGARDVCLVEKGASYGSFWTNTYDRLALHSPWHGLPDDGGLVDRYPIFKTRLEVIDYLERYASRHELDQVAGFNETLVETEYRPSDHAYPWRARTSRGRYRARHVVIATGYCRQPAWPCVPGAATTQGDILHSASYRNGQIHRGQRILVVGSGNSAFEIALDLVECGASRVSLLVNGPRWVIPIRGFESAMLEARTSGAFDPSMITAAHSAERGGAAYATHVGAFDALLRNLAVDVSDLGIDTPIDGPWHTAIDTGRVCVFDHGALALMRSGEIEVINDRVVSFDGGRVSFANHAPRTFDAVILATGYRPGLGDFISDQTMLHLDPARREVFPRTDGRCTSLAAPGLYFVGFDMSPWGGMAHGHWGFEVAEKIATKLGTFCAEMRPAEFSRAPWEPSQAERYDNGCRTFRDHSPCR